MKPLSQAEESRLHRLSSHSSFFYAINHSRSWRTSIASTSHSLPTEFQFNIIVPFLFSVSVFLSSSPMQVKKSEVRRWSSRYSETAVVVLSVTIFTLGVEWSSSTLHYRLICVCVKNQNTMSSIVLRRLAQTCRPTSSLYSHRTFATSPALSADSNANTNASPDTPRTVTLIPGDGIGPEIAHSVQKIFEAAGVPLKWESVDVTPVKSVGDRKRKHRRSLSLLARWKISHSSSCHRIRH